MENKNLKEAKSLIKEAINDNSMHNLGMYDTVMQSELTRALAYLEKIK